MSEAAIEDRIRGKLTGPTGEKEFLAHAEDDLEWCLEQMSEVCRITEANDIEDAIGTLESDLSDAREHKKHIEELEAERDKLKKDLETKTEDLKAAEGALKKALARIDELEGDEPTAAE